jgi:hypothetical protein
LTTQREEARREPGPASEPADRSEPPPAEPPPAFPGGVELSRLIALARLTAAQAVEIAAEVLAEAAGRSEPDTFGPVVIGADGRVVPGPAGDGRHNGKPAAAGSAGPAVAAVLADVAGAARLRGRRADPAAERLLAELDRVVTELPVTGVTAAAPALQEAAASVDRGAVRAELAALVRAVGERAGSPNGAGPARDPAPAVLAAPAGGATGGRTRSARRRVGAWLLSVVVLASVVTLEVAVLRDDIARDVGLLLDAGRSGSAPSAGREADGPPVEAPAPAAAGSVAAVDLRPLAQCTPGAPCTLRLLVRLLPGAEPQVVTWSYRIVDRCTGATDTAAGGSVTVPAGGDRAAAVGTVVLPAVQAVAVVAVVDVPAAAASPPVFAGSCASDRQAG